MVEPKPTGKHSAPQLADKVQRVKKLLRSLRWRSGEELLQCKSGEDHCDPDLAVRVHRGTRGQHLQSRSGEVAGRSMGRKASRRSIA